MSFTAENGIVKKICALDKHNIGREMKVLTAVDKTIYSL